MRQCWSEATLPVCVVLALLAGCSEEPEAVPQVTSAHPLVAQYLADPLELARGEAIYLGSCAAFCHEADVAPEANLFDCLWHHGEDEEAIFRVIKTGIPDTRMVGFGENFPEGDADIWRLVAWIRHQAPQCMTTELDVQTAVGP